MSGNGIQQYSKLEHRLLLLAWLNSLLGFEHNRDLLEETKKNASEGFDSSGRSFLHLYLRGRGEKVGLSQDDLERYDENIRRHIGAINRHRSEPITLRYFQHLAALYTEIVLDRYFNRRSQMLKELNAFVRKRNSGKLTSEQPDEPFAEEDLTKLAYWMATGSGKTLLLHLNYHQFLHYNKDQLDNILLITPNEGLSEQHLSELEISGIPCRRFDLNHNILLGDGGNVVKVIEITKLVEEKRGGGASVPVEAFEGRNLIFVDEGHKGSGGQAWRGYRDALGRTGFTFEYSATFGQALSASKNDPLTSEYGKAIVFDYSYRYFYGDGYGKDFRILNLRGDTDDSKTELLLLGNLLSFYEQQLIFDHHAEALRPYNLEKPLWVFVGSTVNAVYSEHKQKRSDVLTVARFLHHFLKNSREVTKGIEKILAERSGLVTEHGMDLFAGRFPVLGEKGRSADAIYVDILKRIFHTPAGGGLHLCVIRSSSGELALKARGADRYFGLIYVGDTSEFRKLVENDNAGITIEEDALSGSLFSGINRQESGLNILIGAKKFMEGWNSWRVANMGLLNIGRQEGSQIIQLFGRGVRLRGKNHSLKRSSFVTGNHPAHIKLIETLNIFAVRANYMAQFRDYLEREGVETEPIIELPLFVWKNEKFLDAGLVVPRPEEGRDFAAETALVLAADEKINPRVDLSARVHTMESSGLGIHTADVHGGISRPIPSENLLLIDWEQVYMDLLSYKESKGWANLVIMPETPRTMFESVRYVLTADEAVFDPKSFEDRSLVQEAVSAVLRKYMDMFYRKRHEQWDSRNLVYRMLDRDDPNLSFRPQGIKEKNAAYTVRVPGSRTDLLKSIEKLRKDVKKLTKEENSGLPRIYFDRHLYLPLLLKKDNGLSADPPVLEPSEEAFVRDLKSYWETEKDKSLKGREVFLLRNLSRGKGVGFFTESGFYPDFILWIVEGKKQRIVFIEPHGMLHAKAYDNDEKAQLHERLPTLCADICKRSKGHDIALDSYIISKTSFEDLHERYDDGKWDLKKFAEKHILFRVRNAAYDYVQMLFQ